MNIYECSDCEAAMVVDPERTNNFLDDSGWRQVMVRISSCVTSSSDPYFLLCEECYENWLGNL